MLRIRADRADANELGDLQTSRRLQELGAHDQVLVEERARVSLVGADAADPGGEMDNGVGSAALQEVVDGVGASQIELTRAGSDDFAYTERS